MGVRGRGSSWGRRLNLKPESALHSGEVVHFIHLYNGTVEQSILGYTVSSAAAPVIDARKPVAGTECGDVCSPAALLSLEVLMNARRSTRNSPNLLEL